MQRVVLVCALVGLGVLAWAIAGLGMPDGRTYGPTAGAAGLVAARVPARRRPPSRSVANVWISDAATPGRCVRSSRRVRYSPHIACSSFRVALRVAGAGDTVLVACSHARACSFPPETLSGDRGAPNVTIAPASGYSVSFEEPTSSGRYVWLDGLHHVTFNGIGFGHHDSAPDEPNLRIDCSRNVTLINSSGRRFYMFEGNANVTFLGGDWGNYSSAGEEDSTMGTTGASGPAETCAGDSGPRPQSNIVFNGVTWHDVFYIHSCTFINGGQCAEWGGSHPDCFEINGYVDGVTIENSHFYHCGNTMLSLYTDQGDIDHVVVKDSTFRNMSPWSWYAMNWVTTADFTCSGDQFVHNTYMPNAPAAWAPYPPPKFACRVPPGGTPTLVSGNTFQRGPSASDCRTSKSAPYRTIWTDNRFLLGRRC